MVRTVMKDNAMAGIAQEGGTRVSRVEDSTLALHAQVAVQPRVSGDQTDQRLRAMDVEIIHHEVPASSRGIGGDGALDVRQEVGLGAGGTVRGRDDRTRAHVAVEDEGTGARANVLELPPLDLAGSHGQVGLLPLQRLNACQLVGTHHSLPLLGQLWRLAVEAADALHLLIEGLLLRWR